MNTSITDQSGYSFSHNDSQEPAKECMNRMNVAQLISRAEFIALVGKDAVSELEADIGREAHSFYTSVSKDGEKIAYADIHAIHYIFKKKRN